MPPHECALAIVGSRGVPDYQSESIIKHAILEHHPRVVISGGAGGVDMNAARVARELGITVIQFIPFKTTWDYEEKGDPIEMVTDAGMDIIIHGGYRQRNEKIAEACDCLVRISSSTTKTYGSGWTADYAEKLGKKVTRHTV